ncbi:hypothetical protein KAR91_27210 [Candidatus Pacearchaeota archaeon]|nr:hypothetical protein [Candidatus Pacearchaeota archaeon]
MEQKQNRLVLDKAFFSKQSCLKLQYSKSTESIYLHVGKKNGEKDWSWVKTKIRDCEAADILNVLNGRSKSVSFFHKFKDVQKRTWISRDDDKGLVWVRVEDHSKQLNDGEQKVFAILLEKAIVLSNEVQV